MSENALWAVLRKNVRWQEATRHEDKLNLGIADVSFCAGGKHGWMELKHLAKFPARASTIVRIEHLSEEQRYFLRSKGRAAGNCWLLLQVDRIYLLYRWDKVDFVGTTPADILQAEATARWQPRLNYDELLALLEQG